jgi:type IV secretory pathway component VirB8
VTELGPKARRRRLLAKVRLAFWLVNVPIAVALVLLVPERYMLPYLVAISVAANVEGAWSAVGADSPIDE